MPLLCGGMHGRFSPHVGMGLNGIFMTALDVFLLVLAVGVGVALGSFIPRDPGPVTAAIVVLVSLITLAALGFFIFIGILR